MRPPRIPNLLPLEKETMYFITICVDGRRRVLNNAATWQAICDTLHRLDRWFKRWLRESLPHEWDWQEGCFDHLVRSGESANGRWEYIRQNPVRARLAQRPGEWPWQFGFEKPLHEGVQDVCAKRRRCKSTRSH